MTTSFIRKYELFVYPSGSETPIVFTDLRIAFKTKAQQVATPNSAIIRVYNVAQDTIKQLTQQHDSTEYLAIVLNAGYATGNYGAIFKGTIRQMRYGKETPTDSFVEFLASDGDLIYQTLVVNSFPKGTSAATVLSSVANNLSSTDAALVDKTLFTSGNNVSIPRGQVLFGLAHDLMRQYAESLDATWTISNGRIEVMSVSSYLPETPVNINVTTGLIGYPIQTDQGVRLKTLLDPKIRGGILLNLDNSEVVKLLLLNGVTTYSSYANLQFNAPLSQDGSYLAFAVEHEGDSRGTEWYTNITAVAVDPSANYVPTDVTDGYVV